MGLRNDAFNWYGLSLDWRDALRPGDILRTPSGDLRVVRTVSKKASGFLWGCTFVIRRRSWTNRPYTVVTRCDLQQRGFKPTGHRYTFKAGTIDAEIYREIKLRKMQSERRIFADQVRGIP